MNFLIKPLVGLLAASFMLVPSIARGGTLTTGILYRGSAQGSIFCLGTNVGSKPIETMTVSLISSGGLVAD